MELNEKIMTVVAIGMTVLGLGEAYAIYKVSKTSKEVQAFNAAVDEVSQNIDVDIPDKVVEAAMAKAADREAVKAAKETKDEACSIIKKSVDKVIADEKDRIAVQVEDELATKISLVDISDIKSRVVAKATGTVVDNIIQRIPFTQNVGSGNTADIIRACKEAGITDAWDIERVLEKSKEVK